VPTVDKIFSCTPSPGLVPRPPLHLECLVSISDGAFNRAVFPVSRLATLVEEEPALVLVSGTFTRIFAFHNFICS